jgi:hypothetical protein
MKCIVLGLALLAGLACFTAPASAHEAVSHRQTVHNRVKHRGAHRHFKHRASHRHGANWRWHAGWRHHRTSHCR